MRMSNASVVTACEDLCVGDRALPNPSAIGPLLTIAKAVHTRWLSHIQANLSIMSAFTCLVDWLLHGNYSTSAGGMGLASIINTFYFWRTLYFMADLLPILTKVSIDLQSPSKDFTWVIQQTRACEEQLQQLQTDIEKGGGGVYLNKFAAAFKDKYDVRPGAHGNPAFPRMTDRKPAAHADSDPVSLEGKHHFFHVPVMIVVLKHNIVHSSC